MTRHTHHRASRRVPSPKDSDFDHEINLVNNAPSPPASIADTDSARSRSRRDSGAGPSADPLRTTPEIDASDGHIADGITKASPDATVVNSRESAGSGGPMVHVEEPTPLAPAGLDQPADSTSKKKSRHKPATPETAIDILYENQRGGFLCGIPLFSSKALGNLDPPPWTNFAHKASPTDITTAQVPDPSWEWAWPEWRINHQERADEDGWMYSFMFAQTFRWHKAHWYNSFVRRRVWIRKRVKKGAGYLMQDPSMLNPDYFTVRSSAEMDHSSSRNGGTSARSRLSISTIATADVPQPDIGTTEELMAALRESKIDREKIDAVKNYLDHSVDEIAGLQHVMHDVMAIFIFQASRRALLSYLTDMYDKSTAQLEKKKKGKEKSGEGEAEDSLPERARNLSAAVKHADEEVRRLEYWSDVKMVVAEGESKGAVDERQGWDPGWQGLDRSGPKAPRSEGTDGAQKEDGVEK